MIRHESTPGLIAYVQNTQNGWMLCRNYWKWLSHNLFESDDKRYMKWVFMVFILLRFMIQWYSFKIDPMKYKAIKVLLIKSFYFYIGYDKKSFDTLIWYYLKIVLRKKYSTRCMWHDSHHMGLGLSIHKSSSSQIL